MEINWNEAFGLTAEDLKDQGEPETGEQEEQEDAQTDPEGTEAEEQAEEQAEEPEAEEPEAEEEEAEEEEAESGEQAEEPEADHQEQDPQTRKENAARRRRRQQEERIRQAEEAAREDERKKAKEAWEQFFKTANLRDPKTGEIITSAEEFQRSQKEMESRKLRRKLSGGELSVEDILAVVEQSPAIQQMRRQQEQEQEREFKAVVDKEMERIREMDPEIKDLNDILAMDTGKEFQRLVRENGLSFLQAFRLANEEKLKKAAAAKAARTAYSQQAGKAHLHASGTRGQGGVQVPQGVAYWYRQFQPGMTDEEIRKDYAARTRGKN